MHSNTLIHIGHRSSPHQPASFDGSAAESLLNLPGRLLLHDHPLAHCLLDFVEDDQGHIFATITVAAHTAERSTMPQATFHHLPLSSPRSIRLFALSPSPDFDASLEATLAEVDLDNSNYEAVSYVWGSRVGTKSFTCNGKVLLITPNCESALRHLRLKDKRRTLWVDAICIDQEESEISVKERNSQVALMGEIYAKASHTICWLGQGNEFTNELMRLLRKIGTCPSQRGLKKLLLFDSMCERMN